MLHYKYEVPNFFQLKHSIWLLMYSQTSRIRAVWDPRVFVSQKNPQLRNTACITCTSIVAIILDLSFQLVIFSAERSEL